MFPCWWQLPLSVIRLMTAAVPAHPCFAGSTQWACFAIRLMFALDFNTQVFKLLAKGNVNRSQCPTDANSESSRSHAVRFECFLMQTGFFFYGVLSACVNGSFRFGSDCRSCSH